MEIIDYLNIARRRLGILIGVPLIAGLLVGGTAGVAFLLHYVTGVSFGKLFLW